MQLLEKFDRSIGFTLVHRSFDIWFKIWNGIKYYPNMVILDEISFVMDFCLIMGFQIVVKLIKFVSFCHLLTKIPLKCEYDSLTKSVRNAGI